MKLRVDSQVVRAFKAVTMTVVASMFLQSQVCAQSAQGILTEDINGIRPGMTVPEAEAAIGEHFDHQHNSMFPEKFIDLWIAQKNADKYSINVTAIGHIYEIQMEERLQNFELNPLFCDSLYARLTSKYGPADRGAPQKCGWSWAIQHPDPKQYGPYTEVELSAGVDNRDLKYLVIHVLDNHVFAADQKRLLETQPSPAFHL